MKIIIVDDEMSALQTFLGDVIGKTDVDYRFFRDDLDDIFDYMAKSRPTAAFLDVSMPNIDGFTLAKKLIALYPEIRIVFVTGLSISERDLDNEVRAHTVGFLYKPYDPTELSRLLAQLENGAQKLTIHAFGSFECFVGDRPLLFSSAKSKELFALLVAYDGKTLAMSDAISQLWPDMDTVKSKILYRDAVWRLRKTLQENALNCVEFMRARLLLHKDDDITCDYWNYLAGRSAAYPGEFMSNYDWSINYLPLLDKK